MVRYMECSTCGKSLLENSIIVVRTGFTDKYCSYGCAAIGSGFFENIKLTDEIVQEYKSCDGKDWLIGDWGDINEPN